MQHASRQQIHDWMTRLADGDRGAFDPLFEQLWPLLRRFAGRFLREAAEADDAAQQALLRVFARAGEFDPRRDALSWIFAIAANECRTQRRWRQRRREEALDTHVLEPQAHASAALGSGTFGPGTAEAELGERELREALEEVLGTLRPADAETIRAVLQDTRPAGVPAATFRKRLERALRRLKLAWEVTYGRP